MDELTAAPREHAPIGPSQHPAGPRDVTARAHAPADLPGAGAPAADVEEGHVTGRRPPVPPPPVTGDAGVDGATSEVTTSAERSLEAQLAAYERAHRALQDRLADVEG